MKRDVTYAGTGSGASSPTSQHMLGAFVFLSDGYMLSMHCMLSVYGYPEQWFCRNEHGVMRVRSIFKLSSVCIHAVLHGFSIC